MKDHRTEDARRFDETFREAMARSHVVRFTVPDVKPGRAQPRIPAPLNLPPWSALARWALRRRDREKLLALALQTTASVDLEARLFHSVDPTLYRIAKGWRIPPGHPSRAAAAMRRAARRLLP